MEVCHVVQEAVIKTIHKKKKCKKAKWLSDKALQIAEKRSERQRRKGRIHPFECRVPKNSKERLKKKKVFLSEQCKEIEENNRMGKTSDLFKKMRNAKGTFHAKTGTIKERNVMGLTKAEEIKKR